MNKNLIEDWKNIHQTRLLIFRIESIIIAAFLLATLISGCVNNVSDKNNAIYSSEAQTEVSIETKAKLESEASEYSPKYTEQFGKYARSNREKNPTTEVPTAILNNYSIPEMEEIIRRKFVVENDLKMFTIYALANVTGYDEENKPTIQGVRAEIRNEIANSDLNFQETPYINFYTRFLGDFQALTQVTNRFNEPPLFTPKDRNNARDKVISKILSTFYEQANIEEIYNKYNPKYEDAINEYEKLMYPELAELSVFLRFSEQEIPSCKLIINLQEAFYRGCNIGLVDGEVQFVTGASEEPNIVNVLHEYLHTFTHEPIYRSRIVDDLADKLYQKHGPVLASGYSDWHQIIEESLVRAISIMPLELNHEEIVESEEKSGFIMTEYFYNKMIQDFPNYKGSFNDFAELSIREFIEQNW